ncbi:acyltransferase family protein [Flavobacterium sp. GNP001]
MKVDRVFKANNFDFLRFLFAIFVVVSHSYALTGLGETSQWLSKITNHQINWASIGLNGFFVISGYFIFQSLERSRSLHDYFKKRILRVFPGLLVVLIITVCLLPLLHRAGNTIFKQVDFYTYLPRNLSLFGFQSTVAGVFNTNYYHAINGSLWTIRYEFSLYIALGLLFFIKEKINKVRIFLWIVFFCMYLFYVFAMDRFGASKLATLQGYEFFNLGTFFAAGSALASIKFEKLVSVTLLVLSFIILILALYFGNYSLIKHLFFPVLVLCIGFTAIPFFSTFGKYGDSSYGIYIYSFPVQQILIFCYYIDVYCLIIVSAFISIVCGFCSWHLIEKKALRFKKN